MPTIYRIENEDGIGPYLGTIAVWQDCSHNINTGRPNPVDDKLLWKNYLESDIIENEDLYAFETIEQLKNWFSYNEIQKLRKLGFKIKKLKVTKILQGDTQCIFKEEWIKHKTTLNEE